MLDDKNDVHILGINSAYHESAACLVSSGTIVAAAEEERFTRIKHAKGARVDNPDELPWNAIAFVLARGGITLADLHAIGYSLQPRKRLANAAFADGDPAGGWGTRAGEERFHERLVTIPEQLRRLGFQGMFSWLDHHQCHLASAYYPSGFSTAAVLSVDGIGETASTAFAYGDGGRMRPLGTIEYPSSLGFLWERICELIGFTAYDACKVMGLAGAGNPAIFRDRLEILVHRTPDGFEVDNSILRFRTQDFSALEALLSTPRRSAAAELTAVHFDIAAALQESTSDILLHLAELLYARTQCDSLCAAGGVMLNCVSNRVLCEESPFRRVFIQPAAHDAGTAVGAAMLLWHAGETVRRGEALVHAYLGPDFDDEEIESVLRAHPVNYGYVPDIEKQTAKLLAAGKVVGWFHGAMEFGPRALGNRSLLADPRDAELARKLNWLVKHRGPYRPFAPSVLYEETARWFEVKNLTAASDFMLVAYPASPAARRQVPAVVHVDGSSRIQVVRAEVNPRYHRLISEFFRLTGVPMLLNTSFNDSEPIVCTPADAVTTFLKTGIDVLAIGDFLVEKRTASGSARAESAAGAGRDPLATELVRQRAAIMDRFWEDLGPAGGGPPGIVAAADRTIAGLNRLLAGMASEDDPLQAGRTWKYLGDVWYYRGCGGDELALAAARAAYGRALDLLARTSDDLQLAKTLVNLANTLARISGGLDRALLQEARACYQQGIAILRLRLPEEVMPARRSLCAVVLTLQRLGHGDMPPAGLTSPHR